MIALLLSLAASTSPVADTVHVVSGVRIERDRVESRGRLPTAFVTELAAADAARLGLAEVLTRAAGVRVQQYGGLGAFSTVSLRGAPAGQVTVLLDGVPLASAAHGAANLADLPIGGIERIEVYRGLAPLALGPATPGGAINLVTRVDPGLRRLDVVRGAFDLWQTNGSAGAAFGPWSALAHGGYQGADGDYPYHDDNATPFNTADDSTGARRNNRFDAATALATVSFAPRGAFRARLRQEVFHKRQGVPGLGASPALATRLAFTRSLSTLEIGREGHGPWPAARVRGALARERTRFADRTGELRFGRHDTDDRSGFEEATASLDWSVSRHARLELAGTLRGERAALRDAADGQPDPPASTRRARAASATLKLAPWRGPLTLHLGHRWDVARDARRWNATAGLARASDVVREWRTPQAGARLSLGLGLEARANWTDARRNPGFDELFGNSGATLGNPELRAEHGIQRDVGLAWSGAGRWGSATAEWAAFDSKCEDLIVWMRNSASTARAQNVSRARLRGHEASLRLAGPGRVALTAAWSWQRARDEGGVPAWRGRQLPQRPEDYGSATLELPLPGRHARLTLDVDHVGANWLDPANRQRVAPRTLLGAALELTPIGPRLALTLEGRNLADRRAADVGGFPLPGRLWLAALSTRFDSVP